MKNKDIIKALPLLAAVLGKKYGVQVRIGGESAYTNGNIIQLPAFPLDGDTTLRGLVRGYIDHESAHIRDTDFTALKAARLSSLELHIWNMLEDWRVEQKLGILFPGCKANLAWLIRHMFLTPQEDHSAVSPCIQVLDWLLLTVRSWDVPELSVECSLMADSLEQHFPGLLVQLEKIVSTIPVRCISTQTTIAVAREIVRLLRRYTKECEHQKHQKQQKQSPHTQTVKSLQELENMLEGKTGSFPADMGSHLRAVLEDIGTSGGSSLKVAIPTGKQHYPLTLPQRTGARQATTALRTRLQGMLQSIRSTRNRHGSHGRLDIRKLHGIATGNTKLFLRRGEKIATNTAIYILLDCSGSMVGLPMELAGQACFAVCSALHGLQGISIGVTAFPGVRLATDKHSRFWHTVAPLLKHNEKLHNRFQLHACGNTPMDSALWWTLQQLMLQPEPRRILLLVTDGTPDDAQATQAAIQGIRNAGCELYGIGITTTALSRLLPEKDHRTIKDIHQLASAMFSMLHGVLVQNHITKRNHI